MRFETLPVFISVIVTFCCLFFADINVLYASAKPGGVSPPDSENSFTNDKVDLSIKHQFQALKTENIDDNIPLLNSKKHSIDPLKKRMKRVPQRLKSGPRILTFMTDPKDYPHILKIKPDPQVDAGMILDLIDMKKK